MFTLITFIQHTHLYISISIFRIFRSVAITISKLQFDRRRKKIQQHSINLFTNYRHPLCRGPFPTHTASMCEAIMQEILMWLFVIPWTVVWSGSIVHGIFQARIWSGLPFPTPEDLPDPRTEPSTLASPALAGRFFTASTTWEATNVTRSLIKIIRKIFQSTKSSKNTKLEQIFQHHAGVLSNNPFII